jgi:hypothetical protein
MKIKQCYIVKILAVITASFLSLTAIAQDDVPFYLSDRGGAMTTSLFGTFIEEGELLVYPFYEYVDGVDDYRGIGLGTSTDTIEYTGDVKEHEVLLFLAYAFTEDIHIELEHLAYNKVTQSPDPLDTTSGLTEPISESKSFPGLQAQVRWRAKHETESSPEIYTWFEIDYPLVDNRILAGAAAFEAAVGIGFVKGFSWGTITPRISIDYDDEDEQFGFGEWAIEYFRRVNDNWGIVTTVEGEAAEVSIIGELQWHIHDRAFFKFNNGFGLTGDAPKLAPEVGIMFSF